MAVAKIRALRLVMPSGGDMEVLNHTAVSTDLLPVYYGNESMGPHMQVVEGHKDDAGNFVVDKVLSRSRLKLKLLEAGIVIELKKGNDEV